jgi:hypothetical protein
MDLTLYAPDKIEDRTLQELQSLGKAEMEQLAALYPNAGHVFLIMPTDRKGHTSLATYRSFSYLLRTGLKYRIVGLANPKPADKAAISASVLAIAEQLGKVEKVESDAPIFNTRKSKSNKHGSRKTS